MWDWGSFTAGIVGAVLGALACWMALRPSGRSAERRGRLRAIEVIGAEARELSRVREDHPPARGVALQPETVQQMSRAAAAVSALGVSLTERDAPVAAWAMDKLVAVVNAETPAQRYGLVTVLNSTLAGWAAGRISTEWFERENEAAASSGGSEPERHATGD
ncbi:hypothetical protein [Naasia sp. SYSU D00948]|uniref:hypothetical protein n=1 Tax=Naasia sp. SYSU D00948 TaxID=2817379 RepID=UPI001B30EFF5|nr:hypothetical protein [Naasia sp. SYSU D00948]